MLTNNEINQIMKSSDRYEIDFYLSILVDILNEPDYKEKVRILAELNNENLEEILDLIKTGKEDFIKNHSINYIMMMIEKFTQKKDEEIYYLKELHNLIMRIDANIIEENVLSLIKLISIDEVQEEGSNYLIIKHLDFKGEEIRRSLLAFVLDKIIDEK